MIINAISKLNESPHGQYFLMGEHDYNMNIEYLLSSLGWGGAYCH